jgi:hypothetical protein
LIHIYGFFHLVPAFSDGDAVSVDFFDQPVKTHVEPIREQRLKHEAKFGIRRFGLEYGLRAPAQICEQNPDHSHIQSGKQAGLSR